MSLGIETYCLSDKEHVDAGNYTSIAGGCVFHENDNHAWVQNKNFVSTFPFAIWTAEYPESGGKGKPQLGSDVWVGEGCRFLSGVKVGHGAIIGAGSVVTKDVPPYAMAAGNPAKVKYYRFDKATIKKLLEIAWWNWHPKLVVARMEYFKDIKEFIKKYG